MPRLSIFAAAALLGFFCAAKFGLAQTAADKPRVPPGRDPGGVAIAIIGSGIDYTRPEFAARLARDGEGEIIGWDFVDNDRRPLSRCKRQVELGHCSAWSLGQTPGPWRLVVARASPRQPRSVVAAVQMIARTPARVVVVTLDDIEDESFFAEAARRYPDLLFIAAMNDPKPSPADAIAPGNLLALREPEPRADWSRLRHTFSTLLALRIAVVWSEQPDLSPQDIRNRINLRP